MQVLIKSVVLSKYAITIRLPNLEGIITTKTHGLTFRRK